MVGKKPYRFLSVTDVLKRARPRPLVGSVISEGAVVVLYGPPGMGKTLVALDIALSVACGCPWLHHPVRRSGVVYVVGEARGPFGARVAAWQQTHGALAAEWQGCREAEVDYSNIRFLFDELLLLERDDTERFCTGIEAAGADLRPGLIVLDTWACATAGAE